MSEFKEKIDHFQKYIHGYREMIDLDNFDSVRDRFYSKGKYEGMLLGLEFLKSISQSESKETDSNEVKELVEIMVKEHDNLTNDPRTRKTAQAILQAGYTKNKGEA